MEFKRGDLVKYKSKTNNDNTAHIMRDLAQKLGIGIILAVAPPPHDTTWGPSSVSYCTVMWFNTGQSNGCYTEHLQALNESNESKE